MTNPPLSPKANDLVQFDMDSIRQVVAARHGKQPTIWMSDPGQYEQNGRILRDSASPRLLAYSPDDKVLYATDGCNSCAHPLEADLKVLSNDQLQSFARESKIRLELVERLAADYAD